MKRMRFRCWLGLGLFAATASVQAQVSWDQRQVELRTEPGAERIERSFAFMNQSERMLTIRSVKSSCGCTTTKLDKTAYAPGESGQIGVTFTLGDRKGPQVKKVVVRTDDPQTPVTTLTLNVEIPKLVEFSPRLLLWRADEPREAKTLDVQLNSAEAIEVIGVEMDVLGDTNEGRRGRAGTAVSADGHQRVVLQDGFADFQVEREFIVPVDVAVAVDVRQRCRI